MRNLYLGSASFSSYKYTAFWGKQCKSLHLFYELRREREVRWREKGGREQFSKELYKELIAYNWTEEEANGMAGNIDYLISNIIPYQTPQSYAELLNM